MVLSLFRAGQFPHVAVCVSPVDQLIQGQDVACCNDCVATACPLCQINLEAYQDHVSEAVKADAHLPVLYFTQLMGHAFGLGPKELALKDSLTPVEATLAAKVTQP